MVCFCIFMQSITSHCMSVLQARMKNRRNKDNFVRKNCAIITRLKILKTLIKRNSYTEKRRRKNITTLIAKAK